MENNPIKIFYLPDNKLIETTSNLTILQTSLKNGIPHTHVCFGEAQCSTCRIEILEGLENLPKRNNLEESLANRKGWKENIRLACQTITKGDIKIRRLVLDEYDAQIAQLENSDLPQGVYEEVVVLFLDLKDFTYFSEKELAYDVVFALNRYYNKIGDVILHMNGFIDKYIGDSIMAIFGLTENIPTQEFCLDAVYCAIKIKEITNEFNLYLKENFNQEFQFRIGMAYGKAVLGNIGHRKKNQYTAIGKVVNLASRLETANKKTGTEILISDSLYQLIKNKIQTKKRYQLRLKGFSNIQIAYEVSGIDPKEKEKRDNIFNTMQKDMVSTQTKNNKIQDSLEKEIQEKDLKEIPDNAILLEIDKQHSQILFQISHLLSIITGYVKDYECEIYYSMENFLQSRIKITIPVKSITTFIDARDQHLFSPDFFDAENFPNIIFIGNEIQPIEKNQYYVYGNLFIKGITKKIQLFLEHKGEEKDPWGNIKLCFSGRTKINRVDFGIDFNIPIEDKFLMGNEVQILFEFQCKKP